MVALDRVAEPFSGFVKPSYQDGRKAGTYYAVDDSSVLSVIFLDRV